MYTDIPLKRLTLLRAADLLPLLGVPAAEVISVESLELPTSAHRLDNVLTMRSGQGTSFLHVIEWQGYEDPTLLWRFANYLSWLGLHYRDQAITGTIIYLNPASDVGDCIRQVVDTQVLLEWPIHCIRLWQVDARVAVASGKLGLVVLSPLMDHADETLVEAAIVQILSQANRTQQADLLSILGVFAEPFLDVRRFIERIGKEKLMASELINYLLSDKLAELEERLQHEHATELSRVEQSRLEAERARLQLEAEQVVQAQLHAFQLAIEDALIARFPNAPVTIIGELRRITDPTRLHDVLVATVRATDLESLTQAVRQLAA